jgi:hypothetical protein
MFAYAELRRNVLDLKWRFHQNQIMQVSTYSASHC